MFKKILLKFSFENEEKFRQLINKDKKHFQLKKKGAKTQKRKTKHSKFAEDHKQSTTNVPRFKTYKNFKKEKRD